MVRKLNAKSLQKVGVLPFQMDDRQVLCKIRYPGSHQVLPFLNYFSQLYHREISVEWVDAKTFASDLECFQGQPHKIDSRLMQKSVAKKLEQIIFQSYNELCSDVHFETHRDRLKIFVRQQGQYRFREDLPLKLQRPLFNAVKLKALLDPLDTRHPQNGQFTLTQYQTQVHCRISTLPGLHGESLVVRLHLPQVQTQNIMTELAKTSFMASLQTIPTGLFLITGPIGSGKTTTYYALLKHFKHQRVLSLEDPIEIPQPTLVQLQLTPDRNGEMFMRRLLRQSINVIGIGEIRTREHLKLAVNAALTGHCVVATLHASSLEDVPQRLGNLGYPKEQQQYFLQKVLFQSWLKQPQKRTIRFTETHNGQQTSVL